MKKEPDLRKEIENILVDSYDESEQMSAWEVTFDDGVVVPFPATLLGIPVNVTSFGISDRNVLQCHVVREGRERWVAVEDLDDEDLPEDMARLLQLYNAWSSGNY